MRQTQPSRSSFAVGGTRNMVRGNVVTNSLGSTEIFDGATSTKVEFSRLSRVSDGIYVRDPGTTVTRNTANENHDLGISANRRVIDGGGNRAAGHGNPAQCTNIACQ